LYFAWLEHYSCRQIYEGIKPKKRMAARSAAILFLGFAFVLTQSTAAILRSNFTGNHLCRTVISKHKMATPFCALKLQGLDFIAIATLAKTQTPRYRYQREAPIFVSWGLVYPSS
jgi:hypothetical protein